LIPFELTYYDKSSKKFFKFSDFILYLPALLIEISASLFLLQVMAKSNFPPKAKNPASHLGPRFVRLQMWYFAFTVPAKSRNTGACQNAPKLVRISPSGKHNLHPPKRRTQIPFTLTLIPSNNISYLSALHKKSWDRIKTQNPDEPE